MSCPVAAGMAAQLLQDAPVRVVSVESRQGFGGCVCGEKGGGVCLGGGIPLPESGKDRQIESDALPFLVSMSRT